MLAVRDVHTGRAAYVPHLDLDAVQLLMDAAAIAPRAGERDAVLVATLLDGCLRVTEALGLRPVDLHRTGHGWSAWNPCCHSPSRCMTESASKRTGSSRLD